MQTQGFRFSFTPLPGSFSPFLHSTLLYRSLRSIQPYGVVPAPSHRVSRVPWYSGIRCRSPGSAYGAFTLSGRSFQNRSASLPAGFYADPYPGMTRMPVWALTGSARRYSRYRFFFLFLRLLRCFSSPGSPRIPVRDFHPPSECGGGVFPRRVSPFRYPRIPACMRLPAAFRSLSRLSSALSAKASTLCPILA